MEIFGFVVQEIFGGIVMGIFGQFLWFVSFVVGRFVGYVVENVFVFVFEMVDCNFGYYYREVVVYSYYYLQVQYGMVLRIGFVEFLLCFFL